MIIQADKMPDAPFLVCGQCAASTQEPEQGKANDCGHLAGIHRICLTWAIAGVCKCATAFHDTNRIISAKLPWLAVLVEWHIIQARGE